VLRRDSVAAVHAAASHWFTQADAVVTALDPYRAVLALSPAAADTLLMSALASGRPAAPLRAAIAKTRAELQEIRECAAAALCGGPSVTYVNAA
jgi:hypothetical protein